MSSRSVKCVVGGVMLLALAACSVQQTRAPVHSTNQQLMTVIESNARMNGAQVIWVNPPTVRVAQTK